MRQSEIAQVLPALIPTRTPIVLTGPPGAAKTSLGRQAADKVFGDGTATYSTVGGGALDEAPWWVVINSTEIDPVDTRGLPERLKGGITTWGLTDIIPTKGRGVLCIEELPQAAPMVQHALRKLLLDRRLGKTKLGDGWSVIATGNRAEDRAGANRLLTTVTSSVVFLDVDIDKDDWLVWAISEEKTHAFALIGP